jgi:hypothetical protein
MNLKLVSLGLAAALFTGSAIAAQSYGRDSVYANAGTSAEAPATDNVYNRYGRDSVYADERAAPNAERTEIGEVTTYKLGRAQP